MTKSRKIPWSRIVAEGTAIVVSILLAFSIQAWWESEGLKDREQELLEALLDDFDQTRTNLIDGINFHTAIQNRNNRLLEVVSASGDSPSDDEFDRLLADLCWWDSFYPFTTGALNSLIAGGELPIIRNSQIRRMVADWPTTIALVESNRRQDRDFFWDIWMPFLRQKGFVRQISEIEAPAPGRPKWRSAAAGFPVRNRKAMSSIITDDEFHNILSQKLWVQADNLTKFEQAIAQLDELTMLVRAELGDRR